jgi:hypothetical protein
MRMAFLQKEAPVPYPENSTIVFPWMNITETSAWLQQPQAGTKITANIPEPTDFISLMQT